MNLAAVLASGGDNLDALYALVEYAGLASARTLGATLIFTVFVWGRINSGIIRSVLALAMALPVLAPVWNDPVAALDAVGSGYLLLLVKEVALGLLMGFAASLPLEALAVAGAAIDATRGGGSVPGPDGDSTACGQLFMVIALWLFASLGGFFRFADMIYASYAIWPLTAPFPAFDAKGVAGLTLLLERLVTIVVTIGGPLILLFLLTDLVLLVANRLGKQMNVFDLSMSLRNVLLVVVLPVYSLVVVRVTTGQFPALFDLSLLRAVLHS